MSNNNNNIEEPATKKAKTEGTVLPQAQKEEAERVVKALNEHLDSHDESRKEVQDKLHSMCEEWKKEIDDLEDKINSELEAKFKEEDSRLQTALNDLQVIISADEEKLTEALQWAKAELLVLQRYSLNERKSEKLSERLKLETVKEIAPEWFDKPSQETLKSTRSVQEGSSSVFSETLNKKESLLKMGLKAPRCTKFCCRRKVRRVEKSTASEKKEITFLLCLTFLKQRQLTL